jgi:predicted carbohydrate-binding protein with CBM5 and CBM33 domain
MKHKHLKLIGLFFTAGAFANGVHAHGYVSNLPSRSILCKQGTNVNCGAIQYEPQSLEGLSGFPNGGPADGTIASAGLAGFSPLNEQTSSRWSRQAMQPGLQTFTWTFTANHTTRNWRYYLTRPDWNPNQPLSRAAFELTPFCTVDGKMQRPAMVVSHPCTVPSRSGHQIILAVWEIGDTVNSFYNLIDVEFKGGNTPVLPTWEVKGQINPTLDLGAEDVVRTRVFDQQGERNELATLLKIADAESGKANTWAFNLATRINQEQPLLKAGQKTPAGDISPVPGTNQIHAQAVSGIDRVEIQIDKAIPVVSPKLELTGLASPYSVVSGAVNLGVNVIASQAMDVTATLYDPQQRVVTLTTVSIPADQSTPLTLSVSSANAGNYQLVIVGKVSGSGAVLQKTYPVVFEAPSSGAAYDHVFPQNLSQYKAGTRVLQSRDGKVYECKPWPYSGYCRQWSAGSNQFEPGIGSAWTSAWMIR